MNRNYILLFFLAILPETGFCQQGINAGNRILFHGLVEDALTLTPLEGSHITINKKYLYISQSDGSFSFYVGRNDTVIFSRLGYKSAQLTVSDTLSGKEYIAGVYLHSDTLSIGEVIILPRLANLKNELLNKRTETKPEMENAKLNMEVAAYNGKNSSGALGDPATNYDLLRQKQRINAYEKGGIPSDRILGLSPFLILPAASLLIQGLPEKPGPY